MTVLRLARLAAELTLTGAGRQHAALARRARAVGGTVVLLAGFSAGLAFAQLALPKLRRLHLARTALEPTSTPITWRVPEELLEQIQQVRLEGGLCAARDGIDLREMYLQRIVPVNETTDTSFDSEGSDSWADGMGPSPTQESLRLVS